MPPSLCITYIQEMITHTYIVEDRINDGDVALQCNDENSVGRRDEKRPERDAREPDATNELVVDAVT